MNVAYAYLILALVSSIICYLVASKRGASIPFWIFVAIAFGPLAIPFVFFAKPRPNQAES
ncbi:MAG: hypothetical protein V7711_12875 [Pseudomonadales bacterium]